MKKTLSILLTAIVLLSCSLMLFACGLVEVSTVDQSTCTHNYELIEDTATCTKGGYTTYQCSICKKAKSDYVSALGHTTDNGTCERCGKVFEKITWEMTFYVDEFKNPTDEAYVRNADLFVGTFSNSATDNSKLYVRLLIDANDIAIILYEYGSNQVKAYSTTNYSISILDDNDVKHQLTGTMYENGNRIFLSDMQLVSLLQTNQELTFYIKENSKYGYSSTYLFKVTNDNFNKVYSTFSTTYLD